MKSTDVDRVLRKLRQDPRFMTCITAWHHLSSAPATYLDIPDNLHPSLRQALNQSGIHALYSHQRDAYDLISNGEDICVVTPTASGKTMCYNLPVLDSILKNDATCALYIFPTKALAQDQLVELRNMCGLGEFSIGSFTFDGDTPTHERRLAKQLGQIIITNPDMLHQAILPHHQHWSEFFANLRYVVIDEMHHYRGVFGSHVANVLRRLMRICLFYGTTPQFVLASATIANPGELASTLTGKSVSLVDKSGAPTPEKDFIFYNPLALSADGSIRESSINAASRIASRFVKNDIQTLIFARSRKSCELLVQYLRDSYTDEFAKDRIQGYRGGYLPKERRVIEKSLRKGDVIGVAATNALELGIDIGRLDVVVIAGYPGTISSTWQQAGRAGRRQGKSAAILVAAGSPLDQFIINNPDYFFTQSPEYARISPNNPYIFQKHVKCAAYELPFSTNHDVEFGGVSVEPTLVNLGRRSILYKGSSTWNWSANWFPAARVSLRSATGENFSVIDITNGHEVIGEVDWALAPMLIHDQAIYMHKGQQYQVINLDYQRRKAYVNQVNVNYYTEANLAVGIRITSINKVSNTLPVRPKFGNLCVTALATIYRKLKLYTNENLGSGEIGLPEINLYTQGMWFSIPDDLLGQIEPYFIGRILSGIANVLSNIVPLFLMNDKKDVGVSVEVRSGYDGRPTIYLYDSYPGGIGFAEKAFHLFPRILKASFDLISSCSCQKGCPGCIGLERESGDGIKLLCIQVLKAMSLG